MWLIFWFHLEKEKNLMKFTQSVMVVLTLLINKLGYLFYLSVWCNTGLNLLTSHPQDILTGDRGNFLSSGYLVTWFIFGVGAPSALYLDNKFHLFLSIVSSNSWGPRYSNGQESSYLNISCSWKFLILYLFHNSNDLVLKVNLCIVGVEYPQRIMFVQIELIRGFLFRCLLI